MQLSNAYLKGMTADFDGDQITVKGVYTEEANQELDNFRNTNKQDFIDAGGTPLRPICGDVGCCLFALTRVLSNMKITDNKNINFN